MANNLHEKVFAFLEQYRSSHTDFLYWLRERNTGNRLIEGYWFQGNLDYAFVGLYDRSGGSNRTRSIGLNFSQQEQNTGSVFEIVFNEEQDESILKLYAEIMSRLGGFKRLSDTRFQKTLSTIDGFTAARNFLENERSLIDEMIRSMGLEELFIDKDDFESKLQNILSIKSNPAKRLFPTSKIEELKGKYAVFKNDDFFKERVRQIRFIPFAQKVISNFLKNDLTNETLTGLIQVLKNGAKSETVNYHIDKNIADVNLRAVLKKDFSEFGFTGYTGAGKTGITGLDESQLETVKKFILDCAAIKTTEDGIKRVEEFDILKIPQVKCGVYSPWLYYMNPSIFPIKNNSHDGFIQWCNQPTGSYPTAILLFHEVAAILGEKDLGLIDAFTHMFSEEEIEQETETILNQKEAKIMTLNTILYGPPGTGKTYHTINKSVAIANPQFASANASREQLKAEYERLVKDGQIEFVTFHQSMSYEDFIEGIKPVEPKEEDDFLKYEIKDGIFKRLCEKASKVPEAKQTGFSITDDEFQKASFYKMSLGDTSNPDDDQIYEWCINNGYIAIGRGDANNFTGLTETDIQQMVPGQLEKFSAQALNYFIHYAKVGDYVIVSYGNLQFRAIGKIIGNYEFKNVEGLQVHQFRKVEWLWTGTELPYEEIYDRQFSQQSIYKLDKRGLKKEFLVKHEFEQSLAYDQAYNLFLKKLATDLKNTSKENPLYLDGRKSRIKVQAIQDEKVVTIGETANTEEAIYKERLKQIYDKYNSPEDIKNIHDLRDINTAISWTSNYYAVFKAFKDYEASLKRVSKVKENTNHIKNYVLIIDEINRGNVSQIFGELITLIEEDKRAGEDEALTVTLPYSKKAFSVPPNLYIIGTMNTADRSVEALDTALRRRFSFEEMQPEPEILSPYRLLQRLWIKHWLAEPGSKEWEQWEIEEQKFIEFSGMVHDIPKYKALANKYEKEGKEAEWMAANAEDLFGGIVSFKDGVNLTELLNKINSRLKVLVSKDHTIGHAWLMNVFSLEDLRTAFKDKIIPLLQEFFYNDYAKIGLVLGKGFIEPKPVKADLFAKFEGSEELAGDYTDKIIYELKDIADIELQGFKSIYTLGQ